MLSELLNDQCEYFDPLNFEVTRIDCVTYIIYTGLEITKCTIIYRIACLIGHDTRKPVFVVCNRSDSNQTAQQLFIDVPTMGKAIKFSRKIGADQTVLHLLFTKYKIRVCNYEALIIKITNASSLILNVRQVVLQDVLAYN